MFNLGWTFIADNIRKIKISVDNRLYGMTTNFEVVEMSKQTGEKLVISKVTNPAYINNFNDFDVTPSQRILISTNNGLLTNNRIYRVIESGVFHGIRAIDDYFVYAIKEIGGIIVPIQVPIGKGMFDSCTQLSYGFLTINIQIRHRKDLYGFCFLFVLMKPFKLNQRSILLTLSFWIFSSCI